MKFLIASAAALISLGTSAFADFQKVQSQDEFISLINGKVLTRPLVKIEVSPTGDISGMGAVWEVSGNWTWDAGFFCRQLEWGGDDLGYNCQEVAVNGGKIRFTSDKGTGDSADFNLR